MLYDSLNPNMITNIKEIDEQHENIYKKMAELKIAGMNNQAMSIMLELAKTLGTLIVENNKLEEAYMIKYNYPEYKEHVEPHKNTMKLFLKVKAQLLTGKIEPHDLAFALTSASEIMDASEEHDCKLAQFLKEKVK